MLARLGKRSSFESVYSLHLGACKVIHFVTSGLGGQLDIRYTSRSVLTYVFLLTKVLT